MTWTSLSSCSRAGRDQASSSSTASTETPTSCSTCGVRVARPRATFHDHPAADAQFLRAGSRPDPRVVDAARRPARQRHSLTLTPEAGRRTPGTILGHQLHDLALVDSRSPVAAGRSRARLHHRPAAHDQHDVQPALRTCCRGSPLRSTRRPSRPAGWCVARCSERTPGRSGSGRPRRGVLRPRRHGDSRAARSSTARVRPTRILSEHSIVEMMTNRNQLFVARTRVNGFELVPDLVRQRTGDARTRWATRGFTGTDIVIDRHEHVRDAAQQRRSPHPNWGPTTPISQDLVERRGPSIPVRPAQAARPGFSGMVDHTTSTLTVPVTLPRPGSAELRPVVRHRAEYDVLTPAGLPRQRRTGQLCRSPCTTAGTRTRRTAPSTGTTAGSAGHVADLPGGAGPILVRWRYSTDTAITVAACMWTASRCGTGTAGLRRPPSERRPPPSAPSASRPARLARFLAARHHIRAWAAKTVQRSG